MCQVSHLKSCGAILLASRHVRVGFYHTSYLQAPPALSVLAYFPGILSLATRKPGHWLRILTTTTTTRSQMWRRVTIHRSDRRLLNSPSPSARPPIPLVNKIIQLTLALARPARQPLNTLITRAGDTRRHGRRLVRDRLRKRAELRPDFFSKEVQNRARDRRHAGANHPDVALEAAPQRDGVVVVGCVGDFAELRKVLQADDAADRHE